MPTNPATAPTAELGGAGLPTVGGVLSTWEETPDLRFPLSVQVYDRMRREDAQTASVLRAVTLPIRRTTWQLAADDDDVAVRPEVRRMVAAELGLDEGGRRRRRRQGITWSDHLRHALLMLPLGVMPFEQVYEVGDPHPETGLTGPVAHLRKLGPRFPRTLETLNVSADGGLESIVQQAQRANGRFDRVTIGIDRLVVYVNEREGGDWTGLSVLRSAYKHWLIKDRLLRLGPMATERNGMGVPVVTYPEGGDRSIALRAARSVRAGEDAGTALPAGYTLELKGVTGSTRDELPLVKYHDQAIGRNMLAMVLDLGHDNGARSLGDTFVDLLTMAQDAIAEEVAVTSTEHIIRDLVELNYGEDEPYPRLEAQPIEPRGQASSEALAALADKGLLGPIGSDLANDVRRRYRLPAIPPPDPDEGGGTDDAAGSPFADVGLPALTEAGIIGVEEARELLNLPPGAPIPPEATVPASALSADQRARIAAGPWPGRSSDDVELDQLEARLAAAHERLRTARRAHR